MYLEQMSHKSCAQQVMDNEILLHPSSFDIYVAGYSKEWWAEIDVFYWISVQ